MARRLMSAFPPIADISGASDFDPLPTKVLLAREGYQGQLRQHMGGAVPQGAGWPDIGGLS